jgi:hypothetical protein
MHFIGYQGHRPIPVRHQNSRVHLLSDCHRRDCPELVCLVVKHLNPNPHVQVEWGNLQTPLHRTPHHYRHQGQTNLIPILILNLRKQLNAYFMRIFYYIRERSKIRVEYACAYYMRVSCVFHAFLAYFMRS